MDYNKWKNATFANVLEYNMVAAEMTEDLAVQLSEKGNKIHKSLPVNYAFGAVAASADGKKYLQITTDDLRLNSNWFDEVKLCEMTEDRLLKDTEPFVCSWDKIGLEAAKYLS